MSFKKNIITTVFVRVTGLFISFGSTLLLARWLKPDGMGALAVFLTLPMICISLAEMGISQAIAKTVGNKETPISYISHNVIVMWILFSIISVCVTMTGYYMQGLFEYGWICCLIGAMIIPSKLLLSYLRGLAMGVQKISLINISEICNMFSRFIFILLLVVFAGLKLKGALLMNVFSLVVPAFLLAFLLVRTLKISFNIQYDIKFIASLILNGFKYAVALFVLTLVYRVNILILKQYVSDSEIGYFSVAIRLAELIWLIPTSVGMVVFSHSTGSKDQDKFSEKVVQIMRMNLVLCAVGAIVLTVICPYFIKFVFGKEYLPAVNPVRCMLPGIVVMVVFKILRVDIVGRGKPFFAFNAVLLTLFINIVLNYLLIPGIGVLGSSIALSVSYIIGAILLIFNYSKETSMPASSIIYNWNADKKLMGEVVDKVSQFKRSRK